MFAFAMFAEEKPRTDLVWLLWVALIFFQAEDDLTKLEGISPKVSQVLKEGGIATFAALADADTDQVQTLLNAAGLQMMNPSGGVSRPHWPIAAIQRD